ncbi:MAG: nuclear transport factor 2 family protein [Polyangiaceae bacterium]|nr:nuclear transport factor 2 family protein [Polyangiaceae bacterium]
MDRTTPRAEIERVYQAWDDALGRKDVEAALALYAPDATLESPLVRKLTGGETGVVRGRDALGEFIARVFAHQPPERRRYRSDFFTDGNVLMWEYPRQTPDGDQMDFAEVMEIEDGLIVRHRVYWGWFGLRVLERG